LGIGCWLLRIGSWATGLLLIAGTRDACPYRFRISVSQFLSPVRSGGGAASPTIKSNNQTIQTIKQCPVSVPAAPKHGGNGDTATRSAILCAKRNSNPQTPKHSNPTPNQTIKQYKQSNNQTMPVSVPAAPKHGGDGDTATRSAILCAKRNSNPQTPKHSNPKPPQCR